MASIGTARKAASIVKDNEIIKQIKKKQMSVPARASTRALVGGKAKQTKRCEEPRRTTRSHGGNEEPLVAISSRTRV